jgi:hypothetical protein
MGGLRPNDGKNVGMRGQTPPKKPSMPRGTATNPAETGTICPGAAFIWRISVKNGLPARSPEIPDQGCGVRSKLPGLSDNPRDLGGED